MRRAFEAAALLILLATVPVGAAPPSDSLDSSNTGTHPVDETTRWVPGAGIVLGIIGFQSEGSVQSGTLTGSDPPEPVRPSAFGDTLMLSPVVGGTFELMTPRFAERIGRPRLFAHVDLTAAVGFTFDVAKEGVPGSMDFPIPEGGIPESAVPGQGSLTNASWDPLIVTAGFGVAFTVDRGEWRFRIKPSFEYIREEIKVNGLVNRAFALNPTDDGFGRATEFRFIELNGQQTETYHGIGPGLEIEVDAARLSPFVMTVFVSGQAYALLSPSDINFSDTYTDAYGTESAKWHFRPDPWVYRGLVGVRFRWLPDADD